MQDELLVIIDYFSRYHEIKYLRTSTAKITIDHLKEMFSRLGIPKAVRVDNGGQFISQEFRAFCELLGIEITYSPPYWAQANGEVENINKSISKRLKISYMNELNPKEELPKYALMYNVTPHGTTGKSPSELLFGRPIRDKIPSITDVVSETIDEETRDRDWSNKLQGKRREDGARQAHTDDLKPGDKVIIKNAIKTTKLAPTFGDTVFEVIHRKGNELMLISGNRTVRRNISHVKRIPDDPEPLHRSLTTDPTSDLTSSEVSAGKDDSSVVATNPSSDAAKDGGDKPQHVEPLILKRKDGMWSTGYCPTE